MYLYLFAAVNNLYRKFQNKHLWKWKLTKLNSRKLISNIHFLDIKVDKNNTDIYYKDIHIGQYTSFHSQTPWRLKTTWIKTLFYRANKIWSSKQAFLQQIDRIKTLMSWNVCSRYVHNSIINRLKLNVNRNENINSSKDDRKVIRINLPWPFR